MQTECTKLLNMMPHCSAKAMMKVTYSVRHGKGLGLCLSNFYGRGMGVALEGHWRGTGPVLVESFHKSCTKSTILNFCRYDLSGYMQLHGAAGGQPKTLPVP